MCVNVVFAKLFAQRNEFNMRYRMALKYELLLSLLLYHTNSEYAQTQHWL